MRIIESGIPGFDQITKVGGILYNSNTLIYGPPKTGKTIFCNQFIYKGLLNDEPGLYLTLDKGNKELQSNMMDFQWFMQNYIQNQSLYIIDGISRFSGAKQVDSNNLKFSSVNNPTDMMVKLGIGTSFIYKKSIPFRSVLDSLTTLLAFNPVQTVIRFLKAYLKRIKEAGGTGLVAYTEGIVGPEIELMLKSLFDNNLRLDGENLYYRTISEDVEEISEVNSTYQITEQGLIINI